VQRKALPAGLARTTLACGLMVASGFSGGCWSTADEAALAFAARRVSAVAISKVSSPSLPNVRELSSRPIKMPAETTM
jgi:hypothetical protein